MDIRDLYNTAFDYYKVYLKQRTDSFNFFLVLAGLLVSATALVLTKIDGTNIALFITVIVLSVATIVTSFLFYTLDVRTKRFLGTTEEILMSYEKGFTVTGKKLFTVTDELRKNPNTKFTMGNVFRCVYVMFGIFGGIEFATAIYLLLH